MKISEFWSIRPTMVAMNLRSNASLKLSSRVAVGLVGQLGIVLPVGLELVEQQLVGVAEVEAEAVVELVHDARERLELELLLAALALAEERADLADLGAERQRCPRGSSGVADGSARPRCRGRAAATVPVSRR